jgi:hypothetical protein
MLESPQLSARKEPKYVRSNVMGIQIFESVKEALSAGFMIDSPIPDSDGFLHAHIHTPTGWAQALVVPNGALL